MALPGREGSTKSEPTDTGNGSLSPRLESSASSSGGTYLPLHDYLAGTWAQGPKGDVTIGFLGSYDDNRVVLGALPLAVARVNENPNLLPGRKLRFVAANIGFADNPTVEEMWRARSHPAISIRRMTEMRDNGTIAFIGPDNTCQPEALVAAAWNLPMISYKCTDKSVSDKRLYYTFSRTLPPSSKVSKSVVALLRTFNWKKFVMVVGSEPTWIQVKEAISDLSKLYRLQIIDICQFSDYIPNKFGEMDHIVSKTYQRTRVYVFIGEHIALVDFVKCLHRRRLLDKGEYVIISVDDEIYDPKRKLKILERDYLDPFLRDAEMNELYLTDIMGFRSVLKLTPSHPRDPDYEQFCEKIKTFSVRSPFCVPYHHTIFETLTVPIGAAHLYDAVMIYARALSEVLQNGDDPRNGSAILERIKNRSYHSVQGYDVFIDENGDAEGNYSVVALLDDDQMNGSLRMSMQPVGYFQYAMADDNDHNSSQDDVSDINGKELDFILSRPTNSLPTFRYYDENRPIQWVGGKIPKFEPTCGFQGEKCIYRADWKVTTILPLSASLLVVACIFAVRHYRYEHKLACLLWKVDMKDVTIIPTETVETSVGGTKRMIQVCHQSIYRAPGSRMNAGAEASPKRAYTLIGLYKGGIVAIKPIHKRSVDLTRAIRKELKQIREVRHENIIPFIGACVDHGNLCILTGYCARGSLEDVLANDDLHLDHMFVSSLVADMLKGMIYLHDSEIISHGNLRSSNCLVDSRWVLQISDFGLHELKAGQEEPDPVKCRRRLLWRAPELLRDVNAPPRGSQKGDVYSLGIVVYEIIGRSGPWGDCCYQVEDLEALREGIAVKRVFRPPTEGLDAADYVIHCIQSCWDEDPEQRPDLRFVRVQIKEMQAGLKPNIFDNMLAIMEKYAYNLEVLVQERTIQLSEEKKKTEALLHRMLPKTVAEALKRGDPVEAESFDCVTIYFSDIVGFTELSAVSTPLEVVEMLNDLYTCFDSIIPRYDVYKVETIGDAYMVASGLPVRNGDSHAGEVASLALHLLQRMKHFPIRHRPTSEQLLLRIGIHSGQCVAGVVGLKMPRYCLFGDTVNTASRMESSGEALKIHISEATFLLLERLGGYYCEERGLIPIKGKGEMRTYWLTGEDPSHRNAHKSCKDSQEKSSIASVHSDGPHEGFASNDETPDLLRHPAGAEIIREQCPNHLPVFTRSSFPMISASSPASPCTTGRHSSLKNAHFLSSSHHPVSSTSLPTKGCPILNQLHLRAVAHTFGLSKKVCPPEGNLTAGFVERRSPGQFGALGIGCTANHPTAKLKLPRSAPAITFIDTPSSPKIKGNIL
ncbi:guanylate cyclase 32E [Hetaerina americana]|uniref:guanylate cyclase 32E n=1 Tax=Hetaerina americana TaxID=62018 RepID=UPI003A7F2E34